MRDIAGQIIEATVTIMVVGYLVTNADGVGNILKAFGTAYSSAVGALYGANAGTAR